MRLIALLVMLVLSITLFVLSAHWIKSDCEKSGGQYISGSHPGCLHPKEQK